MVGWQPCKVPEQILTTMSNPSAIQQDTFGTKVLQDCICGGLLLIVLFSGWEFMLLHMHAKSIFVLIQKFKKKGSMDSGDVNF